MDQSLAPLADALKQNIKADFIPFDVPGHKGNLDCLIEYFGEKCVLCDKNSRDQIDYLCNPNGCIKEAEMIAAEAFHAANAWFMVGGTTSAVQAMIMSVCSPDDKILLPRNVHSSVINGVILSGAIPVYLHPPIHEKLGISLGIRTDDIIRCIEDNTDAKAIVINNPTYYGICSSLREIVKVAHQNGIKVLVDEAHGAHFYFSDKLPDSAMSCGADMSAVSIHKTGGSLTQSSILLASDSIDSDHVSDIINLSCTTSASYLLMSSLDLARRFLATEGRERLETLLTNVQAARKAINETECFYAFSKEISSGDEVFNFDDTKLSVCTIDTGLAGIEIYNLLRDVYHIQIEFGDINNILAVASIGDKPEYYEELVDALREIGEKYSAPGNRTFLFEYVKPVIRMAPRKAFFSKKEPMNIKKAVGRICCSSVMCYPPGIPILAPGELITSQIAEHILYAKDKRCSVSGLLPNESVLTVK